MTEDANTLSSGSMVPWWSPVLGWHEAAVPEPFIEFWNSTSILWDEVKRAAGYETIRSPHEFITPSCEIGRHQSGHLFVMCEGTDVFFVAKKDATAFWAEKYPTLAMAEQAERRADAAEQLAKAMLGFVRHGHGTWVIDELGTRSKEQREHENEEAARRRQRKCA